MSKTTFSPEQLEVCPCPPGSSDALYQSPEFNQQNITNEIDRVFNNSQPVSTNFGAGFADGFGGSLQIAVDRQLPVELELMYTAGRAMSWASYGSLAAYDYICPNGRKASLEVNASTSNMIWYGNLGYQIYQQTGPGVKTLIGRLYLGPAGNSFGHNHVVYAGGLVTSTFQTDANFHITGLNSPGFDGALMSGQANNPGTLSMGGGGLIYFYLDIDGARNGKVRLALSPNPV